MPADQPALVTVAAVMASVLVLVASEDSRFPAPGLNTFQYHNGTVFVGGTNFIYKLDDQLNVMTQKTTQCGEEESYNKILLYNDLTKELVTCGSGCEGKCETRLSSNLLKTHSSKPNIVPKSKSLSAKGLINNADGNFMVGVTYEDGMDPNDSKFYRCLATWCVKENCDQWSSDYTERNQFQKLNIKYKDNFIIDFKTSFQYDNFTYFVTRQKMYFDSDEEVSKLIRICQKDSEFSSYRDITLQCEAANGEMYSYMQDAVILPSLDGVAKLIGAFTKERNAGNGGSILCSMDITTLNDSYNQAAEEYLSCDPKLTEANVYIQRQECDVTNVTTIMESFSLYCPKIKSSYRYMFIVGSTRYNLSYMAGTSADDGLITRLHASTIHDSGVLLAGTSEGRVIKYVLLKDGSLKRYKDRAITDERSYSILEMFQKPDEDFEYFVLDKSQVLRLESSNCSEFPTCSATTERRNPVCGWCVYEARAMRKQRCGNSDKTDHWIRAVEECVAIELSPKGVSLGQAVNVTVSVLRLPAKLSNDSYKCRVVGETVAAIMTGQNSFTCSFPAQNAHKNVPVELIVKSGNEEIILASNNFLYYNCLNFRSCGTCIDTEGTQCVWNKLEAKCVATADSDSINDSAKCPRLHEGNQNFVHSGEDSNLDITLINLNTTGFTFSYDVPDLNISHSPCNKANSSSIFCPFKQQMMQRKAEPQIQINYRKQASDQWSFIDNKNIVTLYNCSLLGKYCSYCCALKTHFNCGWAADKDTCAYPRHSECTNCTKPQVEKVTPRDGVKGSQGTLITLIGRDFGYGDSYKPTRAMIGGVLCSTGATPIPLNFDNQIAGDYRLKIYRGFSCNTSNSASANSSIVTLTVGTGQTVTSDAKSMFTWKTVSIKDIVPRSGPVIGGTKITIKGDHLGAGNRNVENIQFNDKTCANPEVKPNISPYVQTNANFWVECEMPSGTYNVTLKMTSAMFDGFKVENGSSNLTFLYLANPEIPNNDSITPKTGFLSGGTRITITGSNLQNAHKSNLVLKEDSSVKGKCEASSQEKMVCQVPDAKALLSDRLDSVSVARRRKRQSDCIEGCVRVEVYVIMDGYTTMFTLTYYHDPKIDKYPDTVTLYSTDDQTLTITGDKLTLVAKESDVSVTIGNQGCQGVILTMTEIKCYPPAQEPSPGRAGLSHPEVNVTIGNFHAFVGYLEYKKEVNLILIIAASVGGFVLALAVIFVVFGVYKYRKVGKKAREYQQTLSDMEMEIKTVAREEFMAMHTTMSTVNRNLVEQGFPYHSYQQYACNAMFATDYLLSEPVMSDELRTRSRAGMEKLEDLLSNKFFLVSVITTMERQRHFFIRDKSNFAGNLCAILMGKMDYLKEVMTVLLTNLVQESTGKKGMKTLFRRCESITEKLLSNWLSLCLYPHLKAHTGSPLYLMYIATQKTMQSGPIDAVTGDAKYTLVEEKLLKKFHGSTGKDESAAKDVKFEAKNLTLNMVVDNGEDMYECKVLDCDTITQVKAKCLEQIYVNYPASQLTVDPADLILEWHSGFGGRMILQDEDNTTTKEGDWIRLNTLAHYLVTDNSNMALVDTSVTEQQEDYVNLAQVSMEVSSACDGSIDSGSPLTGDERDCHPHVDLKRWHLIKKEEENPKSEKSAIAELYLNRLFTTKQSLVQYTDPLFSLIIDQDNCPPPVKFLYDFLDDIGERYKVDPDIVHAWKSHSYPIRVWVSLIRMPAHLFDINVPGYVSDNLDIIGQVFMESFSLAPQKVTKDSPPQKLIFNKEIGEYREKVKEFYKNVKVTSASAEQERQYMAEVKKLQQSTQFNKSGALYRFYQQIKPYSEDILDDLAMNREGSSLHLNKKLEEVFDIMEEED